MSALTAAEISDTRRYCGYPVGGALPSLDLATQGYSGTLNLILAALSDDQVQTLRAAYLVDLRLLEAAIPASSDNLDTKQAAVWTHNENEVSDRMILFQTWCQRLCFFLGIPAGPGVAAIAPAVFVV